ncbi:MAG: glutamine synthetase III [Clostridia bacterium]|nr:glutamine synthetase III [Clostridia bacterium]
MGNPTEYFGSLVFNDEVMRARLPKEIYDTLKARINDNQPLDRAIANEVASAMKDWAVEKGATHFTHWFQPMTGITAEKHDSFITPVGDGSKIILDFSGKELIKGEPDASSFPSGGLRATFEARGYTAWDPTSYAFIKDNTLCIPTAFCSYGGEALDKKTPLLRSMEALNTHAVRVLHAIGNTEVHSVYTTVGAEQEYFLVDKAYYDRRKDLIYTGRTLFGTMPPKGQEMDDHYFGVIKPRVKAFMKELNDELWKLGVLAKTEHNEAAPAQHELAPIFSSANIAADHNQLTMEIMKKIAANHGLVCLLHEKPFEGVNGSGKHDNWAMCTDTGENLFNPGKHPYENTRFLLLLCAVIKAVDDYQDLLRISVASAGNDHRLGAHEAPPAIVSMFLGDELCDILTAIRDGREYHDRKSIRMEVGAHVLPTFSKDTTDRNRTSPFAFTGNKFEFRMVGSSMSVSDANVVLNTAVAEVLSGFADILEAADDTEKAMLNIIKSTVRDHERIIFNGNNYSDEWVAEAQRRGLLNLRSTPDALPHFVDKKNIELFTKHNVFTTAEMYSRLEILLETYNKTVCIEGKTALDILRRKITPSVISYCKELAESINAKRAALPEVNVDAELDMLSILSNASGELYKVAKELDDAVKYAAGISDAQLAARAYHDRVLDAMSRARKIADAAETLIPKWPIASYSKLLYGV